MDKKSLSEHLLATICSLSNVFHLSFKLRQQIVQLIEHNLPTDWVADVGRFMMKFEQALPITPQVPPVGVKELRKKLISEEFAELMTAIEQNNIHEVADGVVDLCVVAIGTALAYGIDPRSIWDEVQETNMAKVSWSKELHEKAISGGRKIPVGKVMKPDGWKPPRIAELLRQQGYGLSGDTE